MENKVYLCIDLKSFYASVECVERKLDPLKTNLVVADSSRTEKTICLAVSPALKSYKISGRARLFEVIQRVKEINNGRKFMAKGHVFKGSSFNETELKNNPNLELDFITAPPRMALYMSYSTRIYNIYLKYIAPEDIHVYSIDEVFMDITDYLKVYGKNSRELAVMIIHDVLMQTGITATAGVGTNMYLAKIALDIEAKHIQEDENGVRIAALDEMSYRQKLWNYRPLTDFWRIGKGYAKKLEANFMYTMGDIARMSLNNEDKLYKMFGVNAELLIDHAWGWEPCTIQEVKNYKPETNSISSGQVLHCPYDFDKGKLIVKEMTELLALDLVDKNLVTDQIVMEIGYDIENLTNLEIRKKYKGEITTDHYGRQVPKHARGTGNLKKKTSSTKLIMDAVMKLYDRIVNANLLIRRINITANNVVREEDAILNQRNEQLDMFTDYDEIRKERKKEEAELLKERKIQKTMLDIKKHYGKNAVIKGMNLEEGATSIERNNQIGGHKA